MKYSTRIALLLVLGLLLLALLSCSKDETPTTPNFEIGGVPSYVWDYNHILWFELMYQDATKGVATVNLMMSAKGDNPDAALMIGTQTINFPEVVSYTKGKIYFGGQYTLNTDQPVSYKITGNSSTYEGNISALPKKVEVTTWPTFAENINYSASWTSATDPKFHVIDAYARGEATDINWIRQIAGTDKAYTLLQSMWSSLIPIQEFYFGINAVGYEMKNSNKVLIVGETGNYYEWPNDVKGASSRPERKPFQYLDRIQADINN